MVLALEPMTKIRLTCLHKDVPAVVDSLYSFGAIHVTHSRVNTPDVPLPKFQKISEALIALRAYEKARGIAVEPQSVEFPRPLPALLEKFKSLHDAYREVSEAENALQEITARENALVSQKAALFPFRTLTLNPTLPSTTQQLEFYYARAHAPRAQIERRLSGLPLQFLFVNDGKDSYVLAAVDKRKVETFAEKAGTLIGPQLPWPQTTSHSFAQTLADIDKELSILARKRVDEREKINRFIAAHGKELVQARFELELHAKMAELPNKFSKTQFLNVIEGWVPTHQSPKLARQMAKTMHDRVAVEAIQTKDTPPTKLSNPYIVRRFEFLVKFFSLPQSTELDPTLFIAITFPIIFGMILGDIGYGLLGLILAAILSAKFPRQEFVRSVAGMMFLSSTLTIIFGFVYGEAFGAESFLGFTLHPLIERGGEGISLLIAAALLVGVIHIALGLIVGFVNNALHRHWNHAFAKLNWLGLELSLVFLGASILASPLLSSTFGPAFQILSTGATGLAILSIVGILAFEGINGLFEIPGLLSNLLSYLRIMALGLSGVILAKIINVIPAGAALNTFSSALSHGASPLELASAAIALILFGGLLFLGHMLAFALGMFESSIQSLRLHYVEFFSKFYHGGGIPFVPLRETNSQNNS